MEDPSQPLVGRDANGLTQHGPAVLVIGGTRGTGQVIVRLLEARRMAVRVLSRHASAGTTQVSPLIEMVAGDITKPETLPAAMSGVRHVIVTAGVRSGRASREAPIKAVEYDGILNALAAFRDARVEGRFLYMTASGSTRHSLAAFVLNLYKGNTLVWRRRAEDAIRKSGVDYTIIRAGVLQDAAAGEHAILITQKPLPLSPRYRIGRRDVAEVFVAALEHPHASRATFDAVWDAGPPVPLSTQLDRLVPDPIS